MIVYREKIELYFNDLKTFAPVDIFDISIEHFDLEILQIRNANEILYYHKGSTKVLKSRDRKLGVSILKKFPKRKFFINN
ncbi:MAG: hypothetical protein ACI8WT_004740 [Clostridium sp.]|jgi:hypothetical protein